MVMSAAKKAPAKPRTADGKHDNKKGSAAEQAVQPVGEGEVILTVQIKASLVKPQPG